MIKFVICEDSDEALETAGKYVIKAMMNYDIEYKVLKFKEYNNKFKKVMDDDTDIKIYILDIELPTISGLEIASEIREYDDESIIIFVTAHSECKNDIFYSRLGAIDFISKYNRYEEINYIEKAPSQNKCIIHDVSGDEKYITTSIVKLKSELKPMFYQTHKSCLVNLDNVREIDYSTSTIYFKNGDTTNLIAPSARKGLKQIVGEF